MGEITSSSFEFYEGLRTLVPGGLAVGLYAAIVQTFGIGGTVTFGHGLAALLATLAVGFVLLLVDLPTKAAVFQYRTPEQFLRSWSGLSPRGNASHLTIYYEILDVEMPVGIKTRIDYFRAIYRIGYETIYLAAVAIPVLVISIIFPSVGLARAMRTALALSAGFSLLLFYSMPSLFASHFGVATNNTDAKRRAIRVAVVPTDGVK
jgi:hypothetical protein